MLSKSQNKLTSKVFVDIETIGANAKMLGGFRDFRVNLDDLPRQDPLQVSPKILRKVPRKYYDLFNANYKHLRTDYTGVDKKNGGKFKIRMSLKRKGVDKETIISILHRIIASMRPFCVEINFSCILTAKTNEADNPFRMIGSNSYFFESSKKILRDADIDQLTHILDSDSLANYCKIAAKCYDFEFVNIACLIVDANVIPN